MKCVGRRRIDGTARKWSTSFGALGVLCLGVAALIAADVYGRMRQAGNPKVAVGEYAPDFELPRLTITTDPNDKPIGIVSESNRIRLSSFRGKKPVCLIMSSYT